MFTYFQQADGNVELVNETCSNVLGCPYARHGIRGVYWAWDRSLGAWVHYSNAPAKPDMITELD